MTDDDVRSLIGRVNERAGFHSTAGWDLHPDRVVRALAEILEEDKKRFAGLGNLPEDQREALRDMMLECFK